MSTYYQTGTGTRSQSVSEDYDRAFRFAMPEDPDFFKTYVTAKGSYQFGKLTGEESLKAMAKFRAAGPEFVKEFLEIIKTRDASFPDFFKRYALIHDTGHCSG